MKRRRALLPEDTTKEELEEMKRKVRDLVAYLSKFDDPTFREKLSRGRIRNPCAVLLVIQSERKFERGAVWSTDFVSLGLFNTAALVESLGDWLSRATREALVGKEIK